MKQQILVFGLFCFSAKAFAGAYPCTDPVLPPVPHTVARTCTYAEAPNLFEAARLNCVNLVQAYAQRGDVLEPTRDTAYGREVTPLMEAVHAGSTEAAKVLLAHSALPVTQMCVPRSGYDPGPPCRFVSALHHAVDRRDLEMVKLLMQYHAWTDTAKGYDADALRAASGVGPLVQVLLQDAKDSQPDLITQLASAGSCATLQSLLAQGYQDGSPGKALSAALLSNQLAIVDIFLSRGYSMFENDDKLNCVAHSRLLEVRSREMIDLLRAHQVNLQQVDCDGENLAFAVTDVPMAEKLLDLGFDFSIMSHRGWSPLGILATTFSDHKEPDRALWSFLRTHGAIIKAQADASSGPSYRGIDRDRVFSCEGRRVVNLAYLAIEGSNTQWMVELMRAGLPTVDKVNTPPGYYRCWQPLSLILAERSPEMIWAFLNNGGDLSDAPYAVASLALRGRFYNEPLLPEEEVTSIAQFLLSHGLAKAPPKKGPWFFYDLLWLAGRQEESRTNVYPVVKALLEGGFNPALKDAEGNCGGDYLKDLDYPCPKTAALLRAHGARVCK